MTKALKFTDDFHQFLVSACAKKIRKLPPWMVRSFLAFDIVMAFLNPFWGWWLLYRCTGERYTLQKYIPVYINYVRFCWQHLTHQSKDTGFFKTDWYAQPRSEPIISGAASLTDENPCATCINCCTGYWAKKPARCPFLSEDGSGCRVYRKNFWDYTNCGRYPHSQGAIEAYQCPRFS